MKKSATPAIDERIQQLVARLAPDRESRIEPVRLKDEWAEIVYTLRVIRKDLRAIAAAAGVRRRRKVSARSHVWGGPTKTVRWRHCRRCGVIRRRDGKNSTLCRGAARVTLRVSP